MGAIVITAMWVAVGVSIEAARHTAFERTRTEAHNLAISFEDDITHVLSSIDSTMDAIALRMRAEHGPIDLYRWAHENPTLAWANIQGSIVTPDGTLYSTTLSPNPERINFADREHVRVQLDGEANGLWIGRPVKGRIWTVPLIPVSRRVDADDGTVLGVIVFLIPPASLTNLHRSVNLGERGLLSLAGLDNVVRARFSQKSAEGLDGIGGSVAGGPRPDTIGNNGDGFYVRPSVFDGVTRLFAYHRVPNYPLVVTIGLDLDSALAGARADGWTIGSIAAAATLLLTLLGAHLIREIRSRARHEVDLAVANSELELGRDTAEAANRAKSEFLANMSHELRTPLNAIIGFSELIREQLLGPVGDTRYTGYASDICDAGQHLLHVINEVLDLAKVEAGRTVLEEEVVLLDVVITASIAQVRGLAETKRIRLDIAAPGPSPFLRIDEHKLCQVLVNLLANAIKFTAGGGHVALSTEPLADGSIEIAVDDDGIGMDAKEVAIALEPFGQVENPLTKRQAGTGLGLPLARRLVELHGGAFEINSLKGTGTTIRIVLPASRVVEMPSLAVA